MTSVVIDPTLAFGVSTTSIQKELSRPRLSKMRSGSGDLIGKVGDVLLRNDNSATFIGFGL